MRTKADLHTYQDDAVTYIFEHDRSLALLPVGAGKTVIGWTAIVELMAAGAVQRPLVIAPLRVAQLVWPTEPNEWSHLQGQQIVPWGGEPAGWPDSLWKTSRQLWGSRQYLETRITKITDTIKRRAAQAKLSDVIAEERQVNAAIRKTAPPAMVLHVTSYENVLWLFELYEPGKLPFDMLIMDETGKIKNPKSPRFKIIKKHSPYIKIVAGMNATPAPEGFEDLYAQVTAVDGGALFGKSFYQWRQQYFAPADWQGYKWRLQLGAKDKLLTDLNTIAFRVDEADLSYQRSMTHTQIAVDLPEKARTAYADMVKRMAVELEGRDDLVAMSAAASSIKLRQISNGFIYDEDKTPIILHEEKAHALADLIDDMGREPLLVAYEFAEDLDAIRRVWKNVPYLGQGISGTQAAEHVQRWNKRELPVLALHWMCLHPDTLVLTEHRQWQRIVDVKPWERVFDGVEFVSHSGCRFSGFRNVIDRFGITMTPDHPILINNRWVEAADVPDTESARREARYAYTGNDPRLGALLGVWPGEGGRLGGCGVGDVPEVDLPAGSAQPQAVYDLVDCGPRRRFAVRNADGEVFIVHNSAGHGLNLQAGGSHICWFALPWSLEGWQQTNGRIDRQGQTRRCYSHSIMARDSMDQKVWAALCDKDIEQQDIIDAIRKV